MITKKDIHKDFTEKIKVIDGGICAVSKVEVAGVRDGKYGVSIIVCKNSDVVGVFTSNKVIAAPVEYTKNTIENGKLSAIIANSGNANCFTGDQGVFDCETTVEIVSKIFEIPKTEIAIASTGVIGRKMPMDIILRLINQTSEVLENSNNASINAAKAIMTTDTVYKQASVEVTLENNQKVKIGGICKGTGMIAPNMGTMLCFIATDAIADQKTLKESLKKAVDDSFNMVIVDGDESTNDTVLLFANGESKNSILVNKVNDSNIDKNFQEGLNVLCKDLAKQMAKDGEGATKFIEVEVRGAKSKSDAQIASKSVVKSPLVKSAVFGGDPNWGRIVAAVGYSGAHIDPDDITIAISSNDNLVDLVLDGEILAFEGTDNLENAESIMKEKSIKIIIDLKNGKYNAIAYGCDLTYDYVKINAEYTT
ncbi:bifunctional ornithine acetyltransferase/N-acetylglutamate synthase [Methanobrevibacter arboriphilus]|jgi:glutamate N-acetyltransferase/amino-acid N-acetyltransferase|uniref:Bifunctional ornithine acetyltransferase/N-acetylglutamate synthase n=1 Tax=Methanobrevibacter arboriphilus TaxID=39441 RepID=A0ACA8R6D5_METAZ|nr:bifunctional ornithine acetyltransferase/N-acetylglutamate synthase [Methanobrevibacter arboriphilus]MCC7562280.1 bifunctional ornithine acetyltransferase/N-acetylglutamate synthase [Methanobrevibacter arboriphilus]BBL62986.1 bifunctional ornithine acetyltransferase/N-acetylglutamate synthase [Methanobrevibacter arboriphilus]GLI12129.1 bifunctional ornithine acetyltransferase/N-acetylglutamate synthase [Methanobrevibacter arboriphilus]